MKTKTLQFLQSFVAIPLLASTMQMTGVSALPSLTVGISDSKVVEVSAITQQEMKTHKENAAKIDLYFKSKNLPLAGYGQKFVEEAVANNLDPFLLPAIAMRESTGGVNACKSVPNSVFGWGSCKISFNSIDESIEILALNLGGNNPNTDHHYDGKTTEQILRTYNRVIKNYPKQVMSIMETMKGLEINKDIQLAVK